MSKTKFPIKVKRGHTVVKIYETPSRGCLAYTVVSYIGTKRQRKTFASLDLAMTEAETVANKLSAGELERLTRRYTSEIGFMIGPDKDIPAGSIIK